MVFFFLHANVPCEHKDDGLSDAVHEAVRDPAFMNTTELENPSTEKLCLRDIQASEELSLSNATSEELSVSNVTSEELSACNTTSVLLLKVLEILLNLTHFWKVDS